ncbi:hypothetical protein BR63_10975 [Thermanaerosceptrum fracticalcis]|uniref:SLH domain-containing protein n=1 Tax=Thermanaerosceptrum fracticalcis TaxID=1712410 RepID=A0A7G6E3Y0_THEFR|nr:S-layer homology domain-containing protein [Thermanaerosceptrum fracticalcis]QNB46784.1 hypothetical protein BR63_10975 [Thermanaerosceptrum fracticalcis]
MKLAKSRFIVKLSSVALVFFMLLNMISFGGMNTALADETHTDHSTTVTEEVYAAPEEVPADINDSNSKSDSSAPSENEVTSDVSNSNNESGESPNDPVPTGDNGTGSETDIGDTGSNEGQVSLTPANGDSQETVTENEEGLGFIVSGKIYGIADSEQVQLMLMRGEDIFQEVTLEEGVVEFSFIDVPAGDYVFCVNINSVAAAMMPIKVEDSDVTADLHIKQITGVITGLEPGVNVSISLVQPGKDMSMDPMPLNLTAESQEINFTIKVVPGNYILKVSAPGYEEYLSEEILVGEEDVTLDPIEMVPTDDSDDDSSNDTGNDSSDNNDTTAPQGTFSNDQIQQAISQADEQISLTASTGADKVELTEAQLARLIEANKPVALSLNGVKFIFNPQILDVPRNSTVSFSAQAVSTGDINKLVEGTSFKLADKIYEFKIIVSDNGIEEEFSQYSEAIKVTMPVPEKYWQDTSHLTLDAFYLNEQESKVQPLQASHNVEERTLTFTTNHFSKYAILSRAGGVDNSGGESEDTSNESPVRDFTDTQGHWAQNDILEMAGKGLVSGYEDHAFRPEVNITRAEFTAILVRILKLEDKASITFKDVLPDQWYFESLAKAYQAGIVSGYSAEEFRPNEFITREQMAVMIANAMTYAKLDMQKIGHVTLDLEMFADKGRIAGWAKESVQKIMRANITKGIPLEGQLLFYPQKNASRAEATVMLLRLSRLF